MTPTDELKETESVSDILEELGRLIAEELRKKGSMLESAAKSPQNETARSVIEFIFDQAHTAFEFYTSLARELLSENDFPNRTSRWPAFFGVDASTPPTGGNAQCREKSI